jgi:septal ring factor EnvC (AmiA/AmiB activator)
MTDSELNTPININISKESKFDKTSEYNEFKKYIIVNNIALQEEVKEANNKIKSLESQIQNQEDTEDKYDTRIRYMKGLLQNLNELRNDYNNVSKKTDEKIKIVQDLHKKNKNLYYEIYCFLIMINTFTLFTPLYYINIYVLFLQTFSSLSIPYYFYKIKEKYTTISENTKKSTNNFQELTTQINNIKNEIKKTEESCLSLDNWINEA